jgi:hypothetical protein
MIRTAHIALVVLAANASCCVGAGAEPARAAASPSHDKDGNWVIEARCHSFLCPLKHKQLIAHVRGGRLERLEGLPGTATGHLGPDGIVTITIRAYGAVGRVQGRVDKGGGAGVWSSNSMICSGGDWLAFPPTK